jgi:hypothetical protein
MCQNQNSIVLYPQKTSESKQHFFHAKYVFVVAKQCFPALSMTLVVGHASCRSQESIVILRQPHRRLGIDLAETVVVGYMHLAAVPVGGAVVLPDGVGVGDLLRRDGEDFLDVAIAQLGVGLQHQGDDAADDGRGEAGALGGGVVAAEGGAALGFDQP